MLPDTGERYMSTPLFEGIGEEMDEAEIALSRSTPGCRFDAPAACPAVPQVVRQTERLDPEAEGLVATLVRDEPVLLFALEWCEFCWSVRKLFKRLGIAYRSIDLDSVEYQADDRGGKIRAVLAQRTGSPTIPQIYLGGEHVGGCTELFDAVRDGTLQRRLDAHGIAYDRQADFDPYTLFPKWLQPRRTA
jgi:cysteine synthase A